MPFAVVSRSVKQTFGILSIASHLHPRQYFYKKILLLSQKDEFTRVTTFICTLLTQNASSGYIISLHDNGCITVKAYLPPFSPILQEVFITGSTGASHQPAAFCLLSLLLLILFFVFHIDILTNLSSPVNIRMTIFTTHNIEFINDAA